MSKFLRLIIAISVIVLTLFSTSCSNSETVNDVNEKVGSQLLTQVNLRKEQIAEPTSDRLVIMKNMGMSVDNLEIQRIFIYSLEELSQSQVEDLKAMGIIPYPDSWIPPVGGHPTGFITADMPIDMLQTLAEKNYVVRMETAGQLAEIYQQKQALTPAQRKIDWSILQVIQEAEGRVSALPEGEKPEFRDLSTPLLKIDDAGNIEVKLTVTSLSDEQLEQLEALGMQIWRTLPEYRVIEGSLAYDQVEAVAELNFVVNVGTPGYPWHN